MADKEPPRWEEVKKLLDDPGIPHDQKQQLAVRYASSDPMGVFRTNPEVTPYLNKYDDGYGATVADAFGDGGGEEGLIEAYETAKKSADDAAEKERRHNQAVEDGKGALEQSRKSAQEGGHGGAGAANSNELLDAGKPGLRFFDNFVPLYHKIENDYNDKSKVPRLEKLKERYDEQRDINFDKFELGIDDLAAAEKALRSAHQDMSGKLGGLWNSWTGGASQSSQSYFSDAFTPTVNDRVVQRVSDAASMTQSTLRSVADLVRAKAKTVLDMDAEGGELAGKSVQDWDITIQVANHTDDDKTLRTACTIWEVGIDEGCSGDLTAEVKDKIIQECRNVTRHTFAKTVEDQCVNFDKLCEDTKTKVDEAWKALNEELGKAEENPFQTPGGDDEGGDRGKQPGGQQGGGQQGGGGPQGGGGGAAGGGGGAPAGGGGAMPEAPAMPQPPGADPGQQGVPEEVTLGEGEGAVTVQEPNAQGTTQVTLIGEDGRPRTYDVSFGPEGGQGSGGQGMPGVGTMPAPGQFPGQSGIGTMPAPADGQPVPGQAPGTPIQAGPDGKAVIEEGGRTITLEQTPEGGVKVDIDNGPGKPPVTQTIDFGDDPAPAPPAGGIGGLAPGPPPPVGGGIGGPVPAPEAGIGAPLPPPQVGGFDVPGGAVPAGPGTPPQVGGYDAVGAVGAEAPPMASGGASAFAGAGAAPLADPVAAGPAATTSQSAGMTSMSGFGDGVQNSFGSTSGQLLGLGEQDGGAQDPQSSRDGGASGMASMEEPGAGGPQGASGMASMGDSGGGAQSGSGQGGMAGGGMMGMGGMAGGQQQGGGDQERTNSSPWRTQGQLFDDGIEASNVRFNSVLGEDK